MGRRGGGKGRGSPEAWEPRAGGYPGDLLEGFHWPLEALAASQVSILGYFQPLIIPLCCVCPSSSSYPDPMHCHSPSCSCSRSLALSLSPPLPPSLFLTTNRRFSGTHGDSQRRRILIHNHALGDGHLQGHRKRQFRSHAGRGTPYAHIIQSQGPALGIGSPQSF